MMVEHREHPSVPLLKRQFAEGRVDRREFLRTVTLLGVSAGAAYALVGGTDPFGRARAQAPAPSGSLRIAMQVDEVTRPYTVDSPQKSNITRQVLDFLTKTGVDNVTRPYLLEQWSPSEDLKAWTLSLRRDVTWRSGRPFTADDVVWSLKFATDERNGSSTVGLMRGYLLDDYEEGGAKYSRLWDASAIEKMDDFTIRLNLKNAQIALPEYLFHYAMPMMDPEGEGLFGPGANGTGAFELVEILPRSKAVYRAREGFWGDGPHLETFEFVDLGDDPNAAIGALAAGQVDGLYEADTVQLDILEQLPNIEIHRASTGATGVIRGKLDVEPFGDPRVRMALRRGVDPEASLAVALRGLGDIGEHHHIAPIHPDYAPLPPFARDVEGAKQLLAEAGFPDGLDLELSVPAQYGYLMRMAEAVVQQWLDIGVRVSLKPLPAAQYAEAWSTMPFGIVRWSHRPLGTMTLSLAYKTNGAFNDSGYSNPTFDEALAKAEATIDIEARRVFTAELERIMQEDGPIIQPIWRANFTAMSAKVANFKMHQTSFIFANELAVAT